MVDDAFRKIKPARSKQKGSPKYMLRTEIIKFSPVPQQDSPDEKDDEGKQMEKSIAHDLMGAVRIHVYAVPLKHLMKNDAVDHGDDSGAKQKWPPEVFAVFHTYPPLDCLYVLYPVAQ